MHTETTAQGLVGRLCAALVTVRGRMLLIIGGEERWRRDPGCDFVPLELPGGVWTDELTPEAAIAAIGQRWLGRPLRVVSAPATYGSTPAHAIDRLPTRPTQATQAIQATPAPLLLLERLAPADPESGTPVRRVTVAVFRATVDDGDKDEQDERDEQGREIATLEPRAESAGLLLLSWQAMRQVVRGLPLADLLARNDATLRTRPGVTMPPDALVYLTAEYGERMLLRVAAKYGVQALGKDVDHGTGL